MRVVRLILLYTVFFSLMFFLVAYFLPFLTGSQRTPDGLLSPLIQEGEKFPNPQVKSFTTDYATGLQQAVEDALIGSEATYSVVVLSLTSGETFTYNPTHIYPTASLYKLWTFAVVYQEIENGQLQKDQILSTTIPELNLSFAIASEEAEKDEGEISMTVEEAVERMITVSENYPALLLTKKVGLSTINNFLTREQLTHSSLGQPPKTTAYDIARYFQKLYNGEFVNKAYTKEMLSILKRQQLNDRIPKYLPPTVEVAHKTGELSAVKHDAGIVYTDKGDYVLVLLSESNNQELAAEREAHISENIYSFIISQ